MPGFDVQVPPHVGAVTLFANPLKLAGAVPPLRAFARLHWVPQNVTELPIVALMSPITKFPLTGKVGGVGVGVSVFVAVAVAVLVDVAVGVLVVVFVGVLVGVAVRVGVLVGVAVGVKVAVGPRRLSWSGRIGWRRIPGGGWSGR